VHGVNVNDSAVLGGVEKTQGVQVNTDRQTGTRDANGNVTKPETGQQKMIRLLENLDSRSATTNSRLSELIDETKKK
jgi:hypothetical protein